MWGDLPPVYKGATADGGALSLPPPLAQKLAPHSRPSRRATQHQTQTLQRLSGHLLLVLPVR